MTTHTEIDYSETTGPIARVGIMRDPADCCRERTTSGGCDCGPRYVTEEQAIVAAQDYYGTDAYPTDVTPYAYGFIVSFESSDVEGN